MKAYVKQYKDGTHGVLEFGNSAGNSLSTPILNEFKTHLIALEKDATVRVIIIQSYGIRAFCGGASLAEMKTLKTLKEATKFFMGIADLINTIRSLSKFVVARVQGKVVGGGVGLVAACDYVVANSKAEIKLSELSIGIGPFPHMRICPVVTVPLRIKAASAIVANEYLGPILARVESESTSIRFICMAPSPFTSGNADVMLCSVSDKCRLVEMVAEHLSDIEQRCLFNL